MNKKKLYGLIAALILVVILCGVGLYAALGSKSDNTTPESGKNSSSEQKESTEDKTGTAGEEGTEDDSPQIQGEEGEIIVRPSDEIDTSTNSDKNPGKGDSGSESSKPDGSESSNDSEQPDDSGQPEDSKIELPFVPIS